MSVPQIDAHVDRERAKTYGVALTDVFETLQVYLGSLYVNDFNRFGRTYQVNVQAESRFRLQPEQIAGLKTRNAAGAMTPLGSLVKVGGTYGPDQVMHYNGFPAAEINGAPVPGVSSSQAQDAIAGILAAKLPRGMAYEWTELAYQEQLAGNTMLLIFPLCVLLVYVVLAAQYESWSLPLSVILIVPMTILSAITGVWLTGGDNNVFTQISFLVLAGLACKNAILIVEFAKQREEEGEDRLTAILDACRVRLRPVLMTSVAFIMGVVPLVVATGAGFEIRRAMGVAVFAGMLGVTAFGLFLTPVFYTVVGRLAGRVSARQRGAGGAVGPCGRGGPLRWLRNRPHDARAVSCRPPLRAGADAAGGSGLQPARALQGAGHAAGGDSPGGSATFSRCSRTTRRGGTSSRIRCSTRSFARRSHANLDVRAAVARLDQARAVFDDTALDRFPTVTVGASVDRREQVVPGFTDEPLDTTTYRAGFDAFWEIDLFGRVRSAVRAAAANAQSFDAALDDVRVSVAAEVARNYFELRGVQQQIAVTERSLTNARETLRLSQVRRDAGIGEEQDVASAQRARRRRRIDPAAAARGGGRARASPRRAERRTPRRAGRRPGAAPVPDAGQGAAARRSGVAAAPAPRRACRRAAAGRGHGARRRGRRRSVSAHHDLRHPRVRRRARQPVRHVGLAGVGGDARAQLGRLRSRQRPRAPARHRGCRPRDAGRLRADGPAGARGGRERARRLSRAAAPPRLLADQARESGRAASIARVRYREGLADFLALLDAERTELQAQEAVAQAEAGVFTGVVSIYKSLGGIPALKASTRFKRSCDERRRSSTECRSGLVGSQLLLRAVEKRPLRGACSRRRRRLGRSLRQ